MIIFIILIDNRQSPVGPPSCARLYGFAENRQPQQKPPQEKENELKVKISSCISHSAAFSC